VPGTRGAAGARGAARTNEVSALNVGVGVARRLAARARGPVDVVDLVEADIERAVGVVVGGVGVATRLLGGDALAARLAPVAVLAAVRGDVHVALGGAARARRALRRLNANGAGGERHWVGVGGWIG